jgi:hypothetical protein
MALPAQASNFAIKGVGSMSSVSCVSQLSKSETLKKAGQDLAGRLQNVLSGLQPSTVVWHGVVIGGMNQVLWYSME